MNHAKGNQGFTLIELMLAMGFVSALLLAIAMTVIQIGNIYNRGITYKSVNQAGGALASELIRDINSGPSFDLATNYIQQSWGGRLCIGQYSYIWNYGNALSTGDTSRLNTYAAPDDKTPINFIKVVDSTASYCKDATASKRTVNIADAVELLEVGQSNLAIHDFSIATNAYDPLIRQRLYSISFLIGTNDQTALKGSSNSTACLLADDAKSDPTYCAINQFDIVARAGNYVSK
jgi:type II secretory pathway pseudopilin PulG